MLEVKDTYRNLPMLLDKPFLGRILRAKTVILVKCVFTISSVKDGIKQCFKTKIR